MSFLNSISKLLVVFLFIFSQCLLSQNNSSVKPKLVVGLVVDQMRNDYIYRYWDRFGEGDLNALLMMAFILKMLITIIFQHTLAPVILLFIQAQLLELMLLLLTTGT